MANVCSIHRGRSTLVARAVYCTHKSGTSAERTANQPLPMRAAISNPNTSLGLIYPMSQRKLNKDPSHQGHIGGTVRAKQKKSSKSQAQWLRSLSSSILSRASSMNLSERKRKYLLYNRLSSLSFRVPKSAQSAISIVARRSWRNLSRRTVAARLHPEWMSWWDGQRYQTCPSMTVCHHQRLRLSQGSTRITSSKLIWMRAWSPQRARKVTDKSASSMPRAQSQYRTIRSNESIQGTAQSRHRRWVCISESQAVSLRPIGTHRKRKVWDWVWTHLTMRSYWESAMVCWQRANCQQVGMATIRKSAKMEREMPSILYQMPTQGPMLIRSRCCWNRRTRTLRLIWRPVSLGLVRTLWRRLRYLTRHLIPRRIGFCQHHHRQIRASWPTVLGQRNSQVRKGNDQ